MLISLLRRSGRFLRSEQAVSALEYAVMAGVVIAGVGAAIVTFTGDLSTAINNVGDAVATTDVNDPGVINAPAPSP